MRNHVALVLALAAAACTGHPMLDGDGGAGQGGVGGAGGAGGAGGGGAGGGTGGAGGGPNQLDIFQSGSRLRMIVGMTPDGAKLFWGWHDSARNEDCNFYLLADGRYHCIPYTANTAGLYGYYLDAQCTTPVGTQSTPCPNAPPPAPTYAAGSDACAGGMRVYTVAGPFGGTTLYVRSATSCVATTPNPNFRYYVLGSEVAASSFVEMSTSVE